jgi:glycosyltransferase involved in cell wall biosynthesis
MPETTVRALAARPPHGDGAKAAAPLRSLPPPAGAPSRVVRIIARLNIGGPALHTMHLTAGMAERYPTLLVAGAVDTGEADLYAEAEARALPLLRLPELGRRLRPWQDAVALFKLVRLLRRERPRIVHTHTAKAGTLGRLAAILAGVPVRVHTYHGHVFSGYFGPWTTRAFLLVERLLARFTTRLVTVSEGQARELVERYGICSAKQMQVIPLGLELDPFAPARSAPLAPLLGREIGVSGVPLITIVGRLAPIKNHDLFLAAGARLAESGARFHLVVVGSGPEEPRLRRQAEALGLQGRISFLGWRRDLDRIYAGSDIVVLTSRNEGTPVCLIEALSAGRAVVSTNVGGVSEVLQGGELGLLVPGDDVDALAAALKRLLDDPALRAELGRKGAVSAPRRFGAARLVSDMTALYDDLLSPRLAQANLSSANPAQP